MHYLQSRHAFLGCFRGGVFSCEVGQVKPNPDIFHTVAQRCGLQPERTVFIDDLPQHHQSAAETVPGVSRLHLCGEPMIAPHIDCAHIAGHAHARIDRWEDALPWLLEELEREPR